MGYELHIVRKNDFEDYEEKSNITLQEWLAFVELDSELELTNGYQMRIPGVEDKYQNIPGFSIWNAHPTMKGESSPWLDYGFGGISTKHHDDSTIKKMIEIAKKLNAKVQGDDGEFYDDSFFILKESNTILETKPVRKHWWKFW